GRKDASLSIGSSNRRRTGYHRRRTTATKGRTEKRRRWRRPQLRTGTRDRVQANLRRTVAQRLGLRSEFLPRRRRRYCRRNRGGQTAPAEHLLHLERRATGGLRIEAAIQAYWRQQRNPISQRGIAERQQVGPEGLSGRYGCAAAVHRHALRGAR